MKITVLLKPNSRQESVTQNPDQSYLVRVNAPPIDGRANERAIALLADYFKKPKSCLTLLHGTRGKKKIFEVL